MAEAGQFREDTGDRPTHLLSLVCMKSGTHDSTVLERKAMLVVVFVA